MPCRACRRPSIFNICTACYRIPMNLQARHTGKLVSQNVATSAQRTSIEASLSLAQFWMKMAQTWKGGPDEKVYRARGYAFLARACELDQGFTIERRDFYAVARLGGLL